MLIIINKEVECWLPVKGFEGFYEISNLGRVKSLKRKYLNRGSHESFVKEKIIKDFKLPHGYRGIRLSKNGTAVHKTIHRLVCETYKSESNFENAVVNHINGNASDNRIENLEFVTQKENIIHSVKVLGRKFSGKYFWIPIIQKDKNNNFIARYNSVKEASITVGITATNISKCLKKKIETAKGFKWEYEVK